MPCVSFKDILLIVKSFFSFFKPSLSGSEWLMILRWIAERSSNGSARPWGGPGPPIAGFVMVCPWRPRYITTQYPCLFWVYLETSELFLLNYTYSIIRCRISIFRDDVPSYFFLLQGRVEIVNGEVTIHKVLQTDSGMYQCIAENKYGAVYSNAELKILGNCMFGL